MASHGAVGPPIYRRAFSTDCAPAGRLSANRPSAAEMIAAGRMAMVNPLPNICRDDRHCVGETQAVRRV